MLFEFVILADVDNDVSMYQQRPDSELFHFRWWNMHVLTETTYAGGEYERDLSNKLSNVSL